MEDEKFKKAFAIIETHGKNIFNAVNYEMVTMYYELGEYLFGELENKHWGEGTIRNFSESIKANYPELKGFSPRSIYKMIQFYKTYRHNVIVPPLAAQISWTNNVIIFSRDSSMAEKEFYIRLCIKYNYSKKELLRQIESRYYERYLEGHEIDPRVNVPAVGNESLKSRILEHFDLRFLGLKEKYSEKDLRKAIVKNLKDFILEIGKEYTFVDEEHRIRVEGRDYYIDLLFYNRELSCFVAFELKLGEFLPEYYSKMSFYLEALDRYEKKAEENPSIGVILCSSKNKVIVELAASKNVSPALVATYSTKLFDFKRLEQKVMDIRKTITSE